MPLFGLDVDVGGQTRQAVAWAPTMADLHETIARVANAGPELRLRTVDICVLVTMRLVTKDEILAELHEDRLSDLYVRVVEVVEGGSRLPRKIATHGLESLRAQTLLSRVDGAGLVRSGAYALTRLGAAIADTWLDDESLTRQSLVVLTTALRSKLGEVLTSSMSATSVEEWESVRQDLRVHVASLVEGIDRRRRGLDEQQAEVQAKVSQLLSESWYGAVETCETLLDDTTETLAELKDVLIREAGDLLAILADIEGRATDGQADLAADAAREAQFRVDGILAWGQARHEAWSEYFATVQRFLREHVRMDPDRAVSRRLQKAIAAWPDDPWYLDAAEVRPYLHLRVPAVERPWVPVTRAARDRERDLDDDDRVDWELDLVAGVAAWLEAHPTTTLSQALAALLPERHRFRFAGRITRMLAQQGSVASASERPWVAVDDRLEVEQWTVRRRRPR